jgi:type VI secretion system protein ImpE
MFTWANGGEAWGHIPVRYAGTESATDGALRLARKTEWNAEGGDTFLGVGQRMFSTDTAEYPLLETRCIEFQSQAG